LPAKGVIPSWELFEVAFGLPATKTKTANPKVSRY